MSWRNNPKLNLAAGLVLFGAFFLGPLLSSKWSGKQEASNGQAGDAARAASLYKLSGDAAIREAGRFMTGTWTYTGPGWDFGGRSIWVKWVVKSDGTLLKYMAPAVADNWGQPERETWQITAEKFVDSGRRYYAFHLSGSHFHAVIYDDGTVEFPISDVRLPMSRGNKFPFTK
jgi:hypothetical protein